MVFKTLISMDKNGAFIVGAYIIAFVLLFFAFIISRAKKKRIIKEQQQLQAMNQAKQHASQA